MNDNLITFKSYNNEIDTIGKLLAGAQFCLASNFIIGLQYLGINKSYYEKLNWEIYYCGFGIFPNKIFGHDSTLIAFSDNHYFLSKNGGEYFNDIINNDELNSAKIYCFEKIGNKYFLGTSIGLFISDDDCETWNKDINLKCINISSIIVIENNIFISSSTGGIYKSKDNCNSWDNITFSLGELPINTIVNVDSNIYIGTNNGIYYSNYNTINWQELNNGIPKTVVINNLFYSDGTLFTLINNNLFRYKIKESHIEEINKNTVNIYPNPCKQLCTVLLKANEGGKGNIDIFDYSGKLIKSKELMTFAKGIIDFNFQTEDLDLGIYFVVITIGSEIFYGKVVKI